MTTPTSPHIQDQFSDFVDGELSPEQNEAFQQHLDHCPTCEAEFAAFKDSVELLRGLDERPAPPDFARAVTTSIHHQSKGRFFREWWLFGLRIPQEVIVAILFLIGLGALFFLTQQQRGYAVITDAPATQAAKDHPLQPSDNQAALGAASEIWLVTVPSKKSLRQLSTRLRDQGISVRADGTSPHGAILIDVPQGRFAELAQLLRTMSISDPRFDTEPTHPLTLRVQVTPD